MIPFSFTKIFFFTEYWKTPIFTDSHTRGRYINAYSITKLLKFTKIIITGCFVFTEIFQEPLIGTSNAQLLMTNDSFSSQPWAILYLNETLIKSQYRTQPNDSPVNVKIKNISNFTRIYHNTILKILIKSVPDVIKTTSSTFLKTSES